MDFLLKRKEQKIIAHTPQPGKDKKIISNISKIFRPGRKVDLVFYKNSRAISVKSAIIYDCDHDLKTIIISQTNPVTHSSSEYESMGMTTLLSSKSGQKKRIGLTCRASKFLKDYILNNRTKDNAIKIKYSTPMERYNIRSAYRFEPPIDYEVKGTILHNGKIYLAKKDFKIHNISTGGAGIIVDNSKVNGKSPLLTMPVNETIETEFSLIDFDSKLYDKTISTTTDIVWKNPAYSGKYGYIGTRFVKTVQKEIDELHRYIHRGQIAHIRASQGLE